MSEVEVKQASFEGWAVVEMMGHRKEIGYVTTQAFGPAVLFRVDTPELPEREAALEESAYALVDGVRQWCPSGTKVKVAARTGHSCLVAPGSLYAITLCTEEAAVLALERSVPRPLIAVEVPVELKQIAGGEPLDVGFDAGEFDDDV